MFVVVKTAVKDLEDKAHFKGVHEDYPVECAQFDSKDAAEAAFPGKKVYTIEEYNGFKHAMNLTQGKIRVEKKSFFKKLFGR